MTLKPNIGHKSSIIEMFYAFIARDKFLRFWIKLETPNAHDASCALAEGPYERPVQSTYYFVIRIVKQRHSHQSQPDKNDFIGKMQLTTRNIH